MMKQNLNLTRCYKLFYQPRKLVTILNNNKEEIEQQHGHVSITQCFYCIVVTPGDETSKTFQWQRTTRNGNELSREKIIRSVAIMDSGTPDLPTTACGSFYVSEGRVNARSAILQRYRNVLIASRGTHRVTDVKEFGKQRWDLTSKNRKNSICNLLSITADQII